MYHRAHDYTKSASSSHTCHNQFFLFVFLFIFNVYMQPYGYDRPLAFTPFLSTSSQKTTFLFFFSISALSRRLYCLVIGRLWANCPPKSIFYHQKTTCYQVVPPPPGPLSAPILPPYLHLHLDPLLLLPSSIQAAVLPLVHLLIN